MSLVRAAKRKAKASVPPLLFLLLVAYFIANAINGDRGLKATAVRLGQLQMAQGELAQAQADHDNWERRIAGLQPSHLDPDALDERARAVLNYADPNDVVMPYPKDRHLY